jgi:hypothetical protein
MAEFYLRRSLAAFVPDHEDARQAMLRIPIGTTVRCEITRPRSLPQMRLYWAMCDLVSINHETLTTRVQVDQTLRLLTGHVDLVQIGDQILKLPRAINFNDISQDEWEAYLARAKDAVVSELLPGITGQALEEEILRIAA